MIHKWNHKHLVKVDSSRRIMPYPYQTTNLAIAIYSQSIEYIQSTPHMGVLLNYMCEPNCCPFTLDFSSLPKGWVKSHTHINTQAQPEHNKTRRRTKKSTRTPHILTLPQHKINAHIATRIPHFQTMPKIHITKFTIQTHTPLMNLLTWRFV